MCVWGGGGWSGYSNGDDDGKEEGTIAIPHLPRLLQTLIRPPLSFIVILLLIESFAPFFRPSFRVSTLPPLRIKNEIIKRTFRDRPRSPHPAYLAFAALYSIAFVSALGQFQDAGATNIAPFAAHEVWWAMRDGYVGDLIAHAFRNGGLLVGDVDYYVASAGHHAAGISPLELFWSVRDGYAGNTILSSSTGVFGGVDGDGGMLVDGSNVVTLSPREIWWAIKDGYAYDMIEHWLRNGGLLV